jgi:ABC-type multidrug transport system fused ATPase/permease subunit
MKKNKFVVFRSLMILEKKDQLKSLALVIIQVGLSFIDLLGVALFGVLGALAINGSASRAPGDRVQKLLEFLRIDQESIQNQAMIIGVLAALILVLKTLLSIFLIRRTMFFLSRRGAVITQVLINKLLSRSIQEIQKRTMQENVYALSGGVSNITSGIIGASISIVSDLSLLLVMLVGLFVIDPIISIFTLAMFGSIAIGLYLVLQARARFLGERQASLSISNIQLIQEVIGSYRETIVNGRRPYYVKEIGRRQNELATNSAEMGFMPSISKFVLEISLVIGTLVIGATQFARTDAARSVAVLSLFLAASTRIAPAILRIQQGAISIKSISASAEKTFEMIDELKDITPERLNVADFVATHDGFESSVRLENVEFTYNNSKVTTIKKTNLAIEPGQLVAFVGRSGAGKTTLIDLILGVLQPTSGRVTVNNSSPLDSIKLFPGAIAYVPQDVKLSIGTVRQNLTLGYKESEISDEVMWNALNLAQMSTFVSGKIEGLDYYLGDGGTNLSGGQRQRFGIARALITNPKLLVLDEATSALDSETELNISEAILKLKGKTTVILIAHRLSSIRKCDQIFYIEEGEIKSSGTFNQLKNSIPDFNKQAELMGL